MKFTIVTPSFNQGNFLEQTILSVWKQKGDFELEHIIADGGSTDNTVEIIKKYESFYQQSKFKFQCRKFTFTWWSRKDRGQADALNKGFKKASGDIYGWLNSDDVYTNNSALSEIIKIFSKEQKSDIVVGNMQIIDQDSKVLTEPPVYCNDFNSDEFQKYLPNILNNCFIPQPSTFFKKSVYQNLKIRNYHYGMDWDLWIRSFLNKKKFYKTNALISGFRVHTGGKTTDGGINYYKETIQILKKYNPKSKQLIINQILLFKEYLFKVPLFGDLFNLLFNLTLSLYLFIKFKILNNKKPILNN